MSLFYSLQFLVFSFCLHLFTVFTYLIYYGDLFSLTFRSKIQLEYDYVIVGAGTAGSVIAHRLSTETNYTFLVLEAGSVSTSLHDIPIVGPVMHGSLYDWLYETVPQEYACGAMYGRKCRLPQGKIFGGSSKLNNMVHARGNISHYTNWFHGIYSENYIRKQFEFVEKNILHLDEIVYESELANAILKAAKELGFKELGTEFSQGFRRSKLSQKNGKRWSTSDNLDVFKHVLTNAIVEKLIIKDNTAIGVEFLLANVKKNVYARKGIIISAGTYNSPKILQLSGIGPLNRLKSLGIPVIKNLPVGKNLQDHVTTGFDLILFNKSLSIDATDILNPINMYQYFLHGKGPLTTPGCEVVGFLSTKNEIEPDLQFMVLPVGISSDRGSYLRKSLGIKDEVWHNYFVKNFDKHTATILPIVLHPESRGDVFITSRDPEKPPSINPRYLSSQRDRETLIRGLKFVSKFVATNAMKEAGAYINSAPFPSCENHIIFSDEYWECYIKELTLTSYHPVGTCSMGLANAKKTVVDTSFKVIGLERLYVVDGSVLPSQPSGNINAAIVMMASLFFDKNIGQHSQSEGTNKLVCVKPDFMEKCLLRICTTPK